MHATNYAFPSGKIIKERVVEMKDGKNKRENIITLRLTDSELEYLENLSQRTGKNRSQLIRTFLDADNSKVGPKLEDRELILIRKKLINEINSIGHNINQIVHNFNSEFYSVSDKKRLTELMNKLLELLSKKL